MSLKQFIDDEHIGETSKENNLMDMDLNVDVNKGFEDRFLMELNNPFTEDNIEYIESIKNNILNKNMSLEFALIFYDGLDTIITTDMNQETAIEAIDDFITKINLDNMLSITNEISEDDPIDIENLNISEEKIVDMFKFRGNLKGIVAKINLLLPGKFKIKIDIVFDWMKMKIRKGNIKVTQEESLESIGQHARYAVKDTLVNLALPVLVISSLMWIYKTLKKTKQDEGIKVKIDYNYEPDRIATILSKRDLDKYINSFEKMAKHMERVVSSNRKKELKESPIEHIEKNYKSYLSEWDIGVQKGNYKGNIDYKSKKHKIVIGNKFNQKRTTKSIQEHGYKDYDIDKYISIYNKMYDGNGIGEGFLKIITDIDFVLNNREHIKLIADLCLAAGGRVMDELTIVIEELTAGAAFKQ